MRRHPKIQTERLVLRKVHRADLDQVFIGLSNPELTRYYGVHYHSREATKEQMRWYRRLERKDFGRVWALSVQAKGHDLQGVIAIYNWNKKNKSAEMGFWILPQFQQQGMIAEALKALIPAAFAYMGLHRLYATTEPENLASIRTLESLGFTYEGLQREVEKKGTGWISLRMYSLLRSDLDFIPDLPTAVGLL